MPARTHSKLGGVESLNKLESRLAQYNSTFTTGNPFYYADWFLVHNYREIESRLKDLIGRFREKITKEMYVLHYTKLFHILEYLCGNSICQDRRFLARYMPRLEAYFHYRNLDVSVLKELARRWHPQVAAGLVKQGKHEALADVYESIEELRYYRDRFLRFG